MTIYIEPKYVTRIEDENKHLKERNYQLATINDDLYKDKYIKEQQIETLEQELFNLYLKHYN